MTSNEDVSENPVLYLYIFSDQWPKTSPAYLNLNAFWKRVPNYCNLVFSVAQWDFSLEGRMSALIVIFSNWIHPVWSENSVIAKKRVQRLQIMEDHENSELYILISELDGLRNGMIFYFLPIFLLLQGSLSASPHSAWWPSPSRGTAPSVIPWNRVRGRPAPTPTVSSLPPGWCHC